MSNRFFIFDNIFSLVFFTNQIKYKIIQQIHLIITFVFKEVIKLFSLIKNEFIKLFHKKGIYNMPIPSLDNLISNSRSSLIPSGSRPLVGSSSIKFTKINFRTYYYKWL